MVLKKELCTANDLRDFIAQNSADFKDLYVKEVYNLGDFQYPFSPLFIYSGYSVIMAYLSGGVLSLSIYDKDFFIQHIRGGMFREEPDSEEIYRFNFTSSKLINDYVKNIDIEEIDGGAIGRIELVFKGGKSLHAEHSELTRGTMYSYISE